MYVYVHSLARDCIRACICASDCICMCMYTMFVCTVVQVFVCPTVYLPVGQFVYDSIRLSTCRTYICLVACVHACMHWISFFEYVHTHFCMHPCMFNVHVCGVLCIGHQAFWSHLRPPRKCFHSTGTKRVAVISWRLVFGQHATRSPRWSKPGTCVLPAPLGPKIC